MKPKLEPEKYPRLDKYEQSIVTDAMRRLQLDDAAVAGDLHCGRATFNRYKNGNEGVSPARRQWLEKTFNLRPNSLRSQWGTKRTFTGGGEYTEIKNVITSKAISDALLGSTPPSFKTCVEHSQAIMPTSIPDKFKPKEFLPDYSHFFQPAVIFRLRQLTPPESKLLAYQRTPIPATSQYRLSTGMAVLWAASYEFRRSRDDQPMDLWIRRVHEGDPNAASLFLDGPDSILLRLLDYKLQLKDVRTAHFVPLGVASINLTNTKRKAIYTQYVFIGDVRFVNFPKEVGDWSPDDVLLNTVDEAADPKEVCVDDKGKPRSLDVVAWNALQSPDKDNIEFENAMFRRGFDLL